MPRNRSLPPHLEFRRNGYYWRRRLPSAMRIEADVGAGPESFSKKVFLCLSLRTHVIRDAKILARRLTEMSDLVFAADAETTMAIAPDTQVQLLESLVRFKIEAFERTRAVAGPRSAEAAALDLRREEARQATLRQALYLGDRDVARQPLEHVAAQLGIDLDGSDADWPALACEATKILLDVSREREKRQQGIYDAPTPVFRRALVAVDPESFPRHDIPAEPDVAPAAFAMDRAPTGAVEEVGFCERDRQSGSVNVIRL